MLRLLPNDRWPETDAVGGWWNRQNNPEIDVIGADASDHYGVVAELEVPPRLPGKWS